MMSFRIVVAVIAGAAAGYSAAAFRPTGAPERRDLSRLEARLEALTQVTEDQNRAFVGMARAPNVVVERLAAEAAAKGLGSLDRAATPTGETPEETREAPALTAMKSQGEMLIARATETGRWTSANEEEFHDLRLSHPEVDWTPVLTTLSAAMNNGRLVPAALVR